MNIAQSGTPFPFDYTAADLVNSLFVAANIYDFTSGTPVFVIQVVMPFSGMGVYTGLFTGLTNRRYSIQKYCYTDNTYSVIDINRAPSTDSVQCIDFSGVGPVILPQSEKAAFTASFYAPQILSASFIQQTILSANFLDSEPDILSATFFGSPSVILSANFIELAPSILTGNFVC